MTVTFRRHTIGALLSLAVCGLGLAACGGSSSSGTTSNASSTTTTGAGAAGGGRFAAVRTCLAQQGINLPARTPGTARPPGSGGGGGLGLGLGGGGRAGGGLARRLPAGVTAARFQAALTKCGAGAGVRPGGGARRLQTPAGKAALAKFVTCMQGKGVKLPPANTTGTGPVFNTKGIDTTTPQFKAAYTACQPVLASVLPARRAAGAGAAAGTSTTTTPSAQ